MTFKSWVVDTRIKGVDAIDGLYLWSDRIVQLIVVLSLIANSVAVKADVAVCVYKARIHVISGDIDLFRIFSRNVFPDFYNLPMFNQKISDKDVLCYRCVKYSVLNANHLKNPPLVLDVRLSLIHIYIEYDPGEYEMIMNCRIPKLTLQPILENSIIHGTELKIGAGNLYIRFACTQDRLIICISDDGVGMDEETLAALNHKLRRGNDSIGSPEEKKGGIALVNVNNRIHLIFGDEYGMHIYSVPGRGTDVEITIPITSNDRDVKNRSVLA